MIKIEIYGQLEDLVRFSIANLMVRAEVPPEIVSNRYVGQAFTEFIYRLRNVDPVAYEHYVNRNNAIPVDQPIEDITVNLEDN